jgi:hypothetical protein
MKPLINKLDEIVNAFGDEDDVAVIITPGREQQPIVVERQIVTKRGVGVNYLVYTAVDAYLLMYARQYLVAPAATAAEEFNYCEPGETECFSNDLDAPKVWAAFWKIFTPDHFPYNLRESDQVPDPKP